MADIKYEIEDELGKVSESSKGWTKELNLISWNGKEAKYDLRDWAPDHEKMGKGVTLSEEELKALKDLLNNMDLQEFRSRVCISRPAFCFLVYNYIMGVSAMMNVNNINILTPIYDGEDICGYK